MLNLDFIIKFFWTSVLAGLLFSVVSWYRNARKRVVELEQKSIELDIQKIRDRNARVLIDDIISDANASREKRLQTDTEDK